MSRILDKTDKGRQEIATRKHGLAPRLRTLLVLIDGKHAEEELLKQVAGLGLNDDSVKTLLDSGFISFREEPGTANTLTAPTTQTGVLQADLPPPGESQFQAIYTFYTSTIKSAIGLRGYALQLKVERAASIDDFCALRQPYVEAVLKANGENLARSLRDRLDHLLYLGNPPDDLDPVI